MADALLLALDDRAAMAHEYNEDRAAEIARRIRTRHIEILEAIAAKLPAV